MQYYININQRVLGIIGQGEIDFLDAAILSYIKRYCESTSERVTRTHRLDKPDIDYTWVDYKSLCKDMPMLKIRSTSPIQKRTTRLVQFGFIEKMVYRKTMPCFRILQKTKLIERKKIPDDFKEFCVGCKKRCEDCEHHQHMLEWEKKYGQEYE